MIDGLAVVDKPSGWTSHDVVARCRRIFGQRRVGHSGTLDPDATGVLLVGLGRVTRLLRFLTALPKSYEGEMVLGTATSTLDASGEVVGEWDMAHVTIDAARDAARRFVGNIQQVPPMVSAVKIDGKRLHELARQGKEVERPARPVTIHRLDVTETDRIGVFGLSVVCSSGTYIRTLAADLGTALGGGAHLRNLRRTAIGSFGLSDATPLEELTPDHAVDAVRALRDYPSIVVSEEDAVSISHGKRIEVPDGIVAVLDGSGRLLAVFEDGRSAVVLAAGG